MTGTMPMTDTMPGMAHGDPNMPMPDDAGMEPDMPMPVGQEKCHAGHRRSG